MSDGTGSVGYTVSGLSGKAYKIVTYIKTNNAIPVMVTAFAKGSPTQYGTQSIEADSLGWTKAVTYIGSSGPTDIISTFDYKISANALSSTDSENSNPTVFFTLPEIYETTEFDFYNNSLFPTESPFTYFRAGESYVPSGDSKYSFPSNHRRIASKLLSSESESGGFFGNKYSPVSSILQNPTFFLASPQIPNIKTALASDIAPYKYFVSAPPIARSGVTYNPSITAIYEKGIPTNKIVLKFNTLMTIPTVNLSITTISGNTESTSSQSIVVNSIGVVVLYWTGSAWSTNKWETMPKFNDAGALSLSINVKKISVTQVSKTNNSALTGVTGVSTPTSNIAIDLQRMHLVEVSPRLEIDLSDFVQNIEIDKSLDSKQVALPISSINSNDAKIDLSGIPAMSGSTLVPIFSSQSDQSSTILANLLRKNVKFYINFNLIVILIIRLKQYVYI